MERRIIQDIKDCGGGFVRITVVRAILGMVDFLFKCKKDKYNRVVSLGDLFVDREEKARFLGFGKGTTIYDSSLVIGDVKVGENTWIGPYTVLDGSGVLSIGNNCSIASGTEIYTHDTIRWAISGGKDSSDRAPVKIGDCCYIGSHAVIAKGVTIGDHCIIGAFSLVNNNIPSYSMAFGIPCKLSGVVE